MEIVTSRQEVRGERNSSRASTIRISYFEAFVKGFRRPPRFSEKIFCRALRAKREEGGAPLALRRRKCYNTLVMIESNVKEILQKIARGNAFGEPVVLVAATKTRTAEEVQRAIDAGIVAVGENHVQELLEKYPHISGAERHFIGHLQTNKVKYLVGNVSLIHSADRDEVVCEISRRAVALGVVQDILIQINIGGEATKGGYSLEEGAEAFSRAASLPALRPVGYMAMLPAKKEDAELIPLIKKMRALFDETKKGRPHVRYLSMGMSGDWELCLGHGANMIRLGTAIFGEREKR